ncbi:hypothetical protein [Micromonospora rosaria]|uniref:hypothetical protein n=1 Tax=Micromonospora rosaria TaxID=47874 RepID=UPI0009FD4E50|nr:hypothetical protein [Micromonospora rosaria]
MSNDPGSATTADQATAGPSAADGSAPTRTSAESVPSAGSVPSAESVPSDGTATTSDGAATGADPAASGKTTPEGEPADGGTTTDGGTGAAGASDPTDAAGAGSSPVPAPGAAVLAVLAAGWLAAMLWSTRAAITSAEAGITAISLSAFALPGVISAALVAGAGIALAAVNLLARRGFDQATPRFLAAIVTGLLVGAGTAVAINLTYSDTATTNVIAGTAAAAATIGGAVAGVRHTAAAGAVVMSTLGVLIFVVAFSRARDPLFAAFGGEGGQEALVSAAKWVSRTESLLAGVLAGLLAFGYLTWSLRRARRRNPATPAPRWPAYLVAGAGPGLSLLIAEVIIRIGGRSLLDLASALSEADAVAQTSLGTSRVDNGIWVLFVGALAALIAFGRALGPAPADEDEPVEALARPGRAAR